MSARRQHGIGKQISKVESRFERQTFMCLHYLHTKTKEPSTLLMYRNGNCMFFQQKLWINESVVSILLHCHLYES